MTPKKEKVSRLSLSLSRSLVICWCLDYYDSSEGTGTELSVTLESPFCSCGWVSSLLKKKEGRGM